MLLPQPVKAALRKVMQRFVRILFPAQLPAHNCIHRYRQLVLKRRFPMLKQSLLVLLAASVISIAAPIAAAQSPNTQPSAQGNGGSHHGPPASVTAVPTLFTFALNVAVWEPDNARAVFSPVEPPIMSD